MAESVGRIGVDGRPRQSMHVRIPGPLSCQASDRAAQSLCLAGPSAPRSGLRASPIEREPGPPARRLCGRFCPLPRFLPQGRIGRWALGELLIPRSSVMPTLAPSPAAAKSAKPAAASPVAPAMSLQININGKYFDKENAKISVYDHGFLYGDGVFEGMRSYGGKVFRLKQHLDRLWRSAKAIWLKVPMSQEEMAKAINDTLATNGIKDGYIRLVVTRGAGALGLDPNRCSDPQVIIIADHIQLYPKEMYENGLEIVTASTIRNHSAALSPRIKSLNYLNNIMAKIEGLQAGCVEALMLNAK